MREIRETQQEILEIPRRLDPGADRLRSDLAGHAHDPATGPVGFPGHGHGDLAGAQLRKRVLLALAAATAIAALVVVVGVFWFGWHETRQNRELLGTLPVYPGGGAGSRLSPPLRERREPHLAPGTNGSYCAPTASRTAPPRRPWPRSTWRGCRRHGRGVSATPRPMTRRPAGRACLFTGAAFHSERTLVSVDVLNLGGSGQSYDVFLDRHRNMLHDPCEPQPFTTDRACYDLDPPAHSGRLISRDEAEESMAWDHRRATPEKGLGIRDRGRNRQLPDDIRVIRAAVLQTGRLVQHPAGHPGLGRGDQGGLAEPARRRPAVAVRDERPARGVGRLHGGARYLEPRLAPTVRDGS